MGDQGVGDLVLHVPRRDADHPLADRLLAELVDVLLGEAGERLAVVELELLQAAEAGVLGVFEPRQDRPHGGHLDRVRRDVLALTVSLL